MSKIIDGVILIGAGVSALIIGEFLKRKLFKPQGSTKSVT